MVCCCCCCCCCFETESPCISLASLGLLIIPGRTWTPRDPPSSASRTLGLKLCAIRLDSLSSACCCFKPIIPEFNNQEALTSWHWIGCLPWFYHDLTLHTEQNVAGSSNSALSFQGYFFKTEYLFRTPLPLWWQLTTRTHAGCQGSETLRSYLFLMFQSSVPQSRIV